MGGDDAITSASRRTEAERSNMKALIFLIQLPLRFILALISFTFGGLIGWAGIVLVLLKVIGIIHWPLWVAALPVEYGVLYCLYMTIDGALYRAGLKKVGGYARFTATDEDLAHAEVEQVLRNLERTNPAKLGGKVQS
jgi:hypothetical protein